MEQALRSVENEPDSVEIIVHIAETLDDQQRGNLVAILENTDSIVAAQFCPLRYHLMLVRYDRDLSSSLDVLAKIKSKNPSAKFIGPI